MLHKYFKLTARVSSSNPQAIRPILENLITQGSVKEVKEEFQVEGQVAGEGRKPPEIAPDQPNPQFLLIFFSV